MKRFTLIPALLLMPLALTACTHSESATTATPSASSTPLSISGSDSATPQPGATTSTGVLGHLDLDYPAVTFPVPASGYQLAYTCTTKPGTDENNTSYGYTDMIEATHTGGGGSLVCDGTKQHEITESSDVTFFKSANLGLQLKISDPKHELASFDGTITVLD